MSKDLIEHHDVICATCIGACDEILEGFKFPVVIIDGTLLLPRLPLLLPRLFIFLPGILFLTSDI